MDRLHGNTLNANPRHVLGPLILQSPSRLLILLIVMAFIDVSCLSKRNDDWSVYYQKGRVLFKSGNYDEAYKNAMKSRQLSKRYFNFNNTGYILSLSLLGDIAMRQKRYPLAIQAYQKVEALDLASKNEKGTSYSISLSNLGTAYNANGEYDKAVSCCEEAVRISEGKHGEDDSWTLTSKYMLAQVYDGMGQSLNAIKMYAGVVDSAAVATTDIGDLGIATANWRIGILFEAMGDYPNACVYYMRALKTMVVMKRHEDIYALQRLLAKNYYATKDYARARKYADEQIETATTHEFDSKLVAESYVMKVIVEEKLKQFNVVIATCETCRILLGKHADVILGDIDINNLMACQEAAAALKGKSAARVYSELMNTMRNRHTRE